MYFENKQIFLSLYGGVTQVEEPELEPRSQQPT